MNISVFICDITLCYDSIIHKICNIRNTPTDKKGDYVSIKRHVST
jgi:hypothetical protein